MSIPHPKATFDTWSFREPCRGLTSWTAESPVALKAGNHYAEKNETEDPGLVFVCHFLSSSLASDVKAVDDELGGALREFLEESDSPNGSPNAGYESMSPTLRLVGGKKAKRYMLVGLNDGEDIGSTGYALGEAIASRCIEEASPQVESAVLYLPSKMCLNEVFRDFTIAFYSSLYADNRFRGTLKSIKSIKIPAEHLRSLSLDYYFESTTALEPDNNQQNFSQSYDEGLAIVRGVILARDIVNAPHNTMNSLALAHVAKRICDESGGTLTCKILGEEECERRGMGAFLGVARASETPPQFIHLTYKPSPREGDTTSPTKKVGIVGKGILFDTGGYNIKTAMMELMKSDCGGAAAVFGAAQTVGALKPPGVECHFVVAACENMINDRGYVPSDILVASNGVSIEVLNTDAEGRLTLADALVYCDEELGCEKIIELSTLTGSCMVALGKEVCGIFTENDDLAKELEDVSKTTGEQSWRLPLVKSYEKQLESKIADISNCGTRFGGAITAGLFLQHFVDTKKIPFAHIDVAGPAWCDKTGGTGFGSRLVTEWIRRQGQ
mmetsp:Transcript_9444/g.23179  ORF Transcript_9444/g.23179 Transcript_9444/m.23179 type:complete len:556 (+) Transcript_9444:144-1811(+)|eukprot:CAMPEP_0197181882 /NCGR_PEP_ID=MMETSP1423-20130617/6028_1 /TAXON_ID=476441 /ORGANISM="Pseudo-nitzschia heimii, Strain UNC1101" /LENGTH=555 /DNA_ID=CAMNT_0042632223 /DNA_START=27 /DNA_END=1694 /DNA_ORIENTATION=+